MKVVTLDDLERILLEKEGKIGLEDWLCRPIEGAAAGVTDSNLLTRRISAVNLRGKIQAGFVD